MKKIIIWLILWILIIPSIYAGEREEYYTTRLADLGIINYQFNINDYRLKDNVLRQEIAAVTLWLASWNKKTSCAGTFKDVSATKPNSWACYSVEALADANLIAKNASFYPESNITKAESIWMIVKAVYGNQYSYNENKTGTWQEQVVDFAANKWILLKFSDYNAEASRGFVFEIAANALDIRDGKTVDLNQSSSATKPKKDNTENLTEAIENTNLDSDIEKILCDLLGVCK